MARSAVHGGRLPAGLPVVVLLMAACAVAPMPQTVPGPAAADPLVDEIIAESNRARAAVGARPLTGDLTLQRVAQSHADELADRRVLDHASPTPGRHTLAERISASGVSLREAGENLARLDARTGDVARATIRMWLASDGHRQNLLRPSFTHAGVGVARDGRGDWYVVQVYLLPVGDSP